MKLLLVNTPINRHDILGGFSSIYKDLKMIPTGMAYLASCARNAGVDVSILDQYAECLTLKEVYDLIAESGPDLIGYNATTPNYFAVIDMARHIRKKFPGILTVFGGIHPSIFPKDVLEEEAVDFVIRGEGERSLVELCLALAGNKTGFKDIAGLSFKNSSGQIHNGDSESIDLQTLPFPAYDLLPMHSYDSPSYTKFGHPVFQMIASRGCPFSCAYCINAKSNVSAKYRRRDLDSVVDEMELLADKYNARQIQFWDPIFPLGRKHALEFCGKVTDRGLHKRIVWNSTTRAEFLTDEIAKVMVKAGCRGIGFGIESGVSELLRRVNKLSDLGKVRQTCKIARDNGLVVMAGFILGFPGETKQMSQQTIDFAKSLDLHYAQFNIMIPYPGTPLYKELQERGEIPQAQENDYVRYNQSVGLTQIDPIYVPKGRKAAELKKMQRAAYIQFYLRPGLLFMHLSHLRCSRILGMIRSFMAVVGLVIQNITEKIKENKKNGIGYNY